MYGFDGSPSDVVDPLGLSVVSKCVSPDTAKQVLEAERVGSGLKDDASHRAASYVSAEQLQAGKEFDLVGGDKVQRRLIQTEGSMDGQAGVFEYILEPQGTVSHQRFIKGGTITGTPNQKVPKR